MALPIKSLQLIDYRSQARVAKISNFSILDLLIGCLSDHCNEVQGETMTTLKAAQCLWSGRIFPENLLIYSFSLTVINSLTNIIPTLVHAHECQGLKVTAVKLGPV